MARDRPLGMFPLGIRVNIASLGLCVGAREWVVAAPQWASGGVPWHENPSVGAGTAPHGKQHSD